MDLIRFIKVLLKRKKLLVIIPLIGMAAAFLLTMKGAEVYKSETMLSAGIIDDTRISLEENVVEKTSSFVTATKFSNLIQMIKSKSVIDLVSYQLLLHDLTADQPFRKFSKESALLLKSGTDEMIQALEERKISFQPGPFTEETDRNIRRLIAAQKYSFEEISKKLKVERVGESDFIKMTFESENPYLSAFILNTLTQTFMGYYKTIMGEKTTESVDFFSKLAEEKKRELNELVQRLKEFKMDNKIVNLYEQTKSIVNQISSLEIIRENEVKKIPSLTKALNDIDKKFTPEERKYIEAEYSRNSRIISEIKEKINSLSARVIESGYTDKAAQDSVAQLRSRLASLVTTMSDNLVLNPNASMQNLVERKLEYEIELAIANENVKSNDRELGRLQTIVQSFAPSEATISGIEREISVAAESYLVILNKLNVAKFAVQDMGKSIQQTEIALPAEKPEPNKKLLLIILIGAISFVLTVVAIFVLEYIDLTIQSPGRFVRFSGLTTIGDINQLYTKTVNIKEIFNGASSDPSLVYFKNALKNLRYNVSNLLSQGKIFLVTGTSQKTGKSFIVSVLAYAISLTGKKVLIIDANFRNNSLSMQFSSENGAEELMAGEGDLFARIKQSSVAGVESIGTDIRNQSPGELIDEAGFRKNLQELSSHYDVILIEAPSMNSDTDAKELFSFADHILMVFSARGILEPADKRSIDFVKKSGKSFSAILNGIEYENLEELQGEMAKQRSAFRSYIKKLIKRNLEGKKDKTSEMRMG